MTLVPRHLWTTLPGLAPAWQSHHVLALLSGKHAESVHAFIQQAPVEPLLSVRLILACRGYINVQKSLPSATPTPCLLTSPREHAQRPQEEEPQVVGEERWKVQPANPRPSPKAVLPPHPTATSECIWRRDHGRLSRIPRWLWPSKTMSPVIRTQRQAHREGRKSQAEVRSAATGKQAETVRRRQQLRKSLLQTPTHSPQTARLSTR